MESIPEVSQLGDDELRERIRAARREEDQISYERRILHGRIDVVRGEIKTRIDRARGTGEGGDGLDALLSRLTEVLTHQGPPPLEAELAELGQSLHEGEPLELPDGELPELSQLDDQELTAVVRALVKRERQVSDQRNELHRTIDQLRTEHVARLQRQYGGSASDVE